MTLEMMFLGVMYNWSLVYKEKQKNREGVLFP